MTIGALVCAISVGSASFADGPNTTSYSWLKKFANGEFTEEEMFSVWKQWFAGGFDTILLRIAMDQDFLPKTYNAFKTLMQQSTNPLADWAEKKKLYPEAAKTVYDFLVGTNNARKLFLEFHQDAEEFKKKHPELIRQLEEAEIAHQRTVDRMNAVLDGEVLPPKTENGPEIKKPGLVQIVGKSITEDAREDLERYIRLWKKQSNADPLIEWLKTHEPSLTKVKNKDAEKFRDWLRRFKDAQRAEAYATYDVREKMEPIEEFIQPYLAKLDEAPYHPIDDLEVTKPGRMTYDRKSRRVGEAISMLKKKCTDLNAKVLKHLDDAGVVNGWVPTVGRGAYVGFAVAQLGWTGVTGALWLRSWARLQKKHKELPIVVAENQVAEKARVGEVTKAVEINTTASVPVQLIEQQPHYQKILDVWNEVLKSHYDGEDGINAAVIGSGTGMELDLEAAKGVFHNKTSLDNSIIQAIQAVQAKNIAFKDASAAEMRVFWALSPKSEKKKDAYRKFVKQLYIETLRSQFEGLIEKRPDVFEDVINKMVAETMEKAAKVDLEMPEKYVVHPVIKEQLEEKFGVGKTKKPDGTPQTTQETPATAPAATKPVNSAPTTQNQPSPTVPTVGADMVPGTPAVPTANMGEPMFMPASIDLTPQTESIKVGNNDTMSPASASPTNTPSDHGMPILRVTPSLKDFFDDPGQILNKLRLFADGISERLKHFEKASAIPANSLAVDTQQPTAMQETLGLGN